jgi:nitroimidazol reductase NimA-like FMN-containing flavoprotein (pyridoxamine 5'-phosphate oxidase superfamily)
MSADPGSTAELFQLDETTCLSLLTTQHLGRLVVDGGDPAVVPVNYRLVDGVSAFRTEAGSRADGADRQQVMFEVDMFDDRTRSGWSVLVRGRLVAKSLDDTSVSIDTWAPGLRDRRITISLDVVSGRLLRSAPDSSTDRVGGYL